MTDHAIENAKGWLASIIEMVAALDAAGDEAEERIRPGPRRLAPAGTRARGRARGV
jgi:hypothetical protein